MPKDETMNGMLDQIIGMQNQINQEVAAAMRALGAARVLIGVEGVAPAAVRAEIEKALEALARIAN